jgi:hypothetical protein
MILSPVSDFLEGRNRQSVTPMTESAATPVILLSEIKES